MKTNIKIWFVSIVFLFLLLAITGGDNRKSIPPTCAGTGAVFIFRGTNDAGDEIFTKSLVDFIIAHPELKPVSYTPITHQGNTPTEYLVIFLLSSLLHLALHRLLQTPIPALTSHWKPNETSMGEQ